MAYNIPFTDDANKGTITVEDNAINTETSLLLPGRNLADYGGALNTNFLHLMENFADVNPPANPVEGQLWYDTTNGVDQLKIYDGTNWVAAGGLKKGPTEPEGSNSIVGDLWVNTSTAQLSLYTGAGWVLVGPTYSNSNKTGALPEILIDTSDANRDVIVNYVNNVPVSILSAVEFTPKSPISGFGKIAAGLTLKDDLYLKGKASQAAYLLETPGAITQPTGTVGLSSLARTDPAGGVQTFNNKVKLPNAGLEVGNIKTISLLVEGQSGVLELSQAGTFDIRTPVSTSPVIRVSNNGNLGINNLGPAEALDLKGNINIGVDDGDDAALDTTGKLIVNSEFDSIGPNVGALTVKGGAGIAKQLQVGSTLTANDTIIVANQAGSILPPSSTNISTIGSSLNKFAGMYANNFYGNFVGNLTGSVTGNATSATSTTALSTSRNFSLTGDVTASAIAFNGTANVSLATSLSPSFVNTKPSITTASPNTIQDTDEVLINRSGTLYKATQSDIRNSLSSIPIGTVIMYAGLTAPTGWFICDGTDKDLTVYGDLATALGFNAADSLTWYWGNPSPGNFKIPDYRGRMPVGLGAPGGANRISDSAVSTMGGVAGSEDVTLNANNLPEHQHDLKSSTGEQFYAVTNATTSAPETLSGGGIDGGTGSRLPVSGSVFDGTTNTPVDIINPFATINFIIYHGAT